MNWKSWDLSDATWEPANHVNAPALVKAYFSQNKHQEKEIKVQRIRQDGV
jgi:hypothetical protein